MFTAENAWIIWLVVGLVLIAVEAASADFVFVMLGGGALAGSVAAALGAHVLTQAVVAAAVAGLLLTIVRPLVKRRIVSPPPARLGAAAHVGQRVVVTESVDAHGGRVRLAGDIWSARLESAGDASAGDASAGDARSNPLEPARAPVSRLEPGELARVVRIDGATAVVTAAPQH